MVPGPLQPLASGPEWVRIDNDSVPLSKTRRSGCLTFVDRTWVVSNLDAAWLALLWTYRDSCFLCSVRTNLSFFCFPYLRLPDRYTLTVPSSVKPYRRPPVRKGIETFLNAPKRNSLFSLLNAFHECWRLMWVQASCHCSLWSFAVHLYSRQFCA